MTNHLHYFRCKVGSFSQCNSSRLTYLFSIWYHSSQLARHDNDAWSEALEKNSRQEAATSLSSISFNRLDHSWISFLSSSWVWSKNVWISLVSWVVFFLSIFLHSIENFILKVELVVLICCQCGLYTNSYYCISWVIELFTYFQKDICDEIKRNLFLHYAYAHSIWSTSLVG